MLMAAARGNAAAIFLVKTRHNLPRRGKNQRSWQNISVFLTKNVF